MIVIAIVKPAELPTACTVFTDVSASTIEEEKTAAAAAAAVNAKQDTHEQKNQSFQEAEVYHEAVL